MKIPVEVLVQQLNQIPGIKVTIQYDATGKSSELYPGMTVPEYATYWLRQYKMTHVKGNTFQGTYEEPVNLHINPFFKNVQIQSVTPADVRAFFNFKTAQGYALETLNKMRMCLNAIFTTALENHLCFINPVTSTLKLHSDKPPKEKKCWTKEQCELAYRFADNHPKGLAIQIILETAISRSEVLGLQWSDHDQDKRVLAINDGLVYVKNPITGKASLVRDGLKNQYRKRILPISTYLNARLALEPRAVTRKGRSVQTDYIIHAPRGGPFNPRNWYDREYKLFMCDLMEEHPQIPMLTPHELRHTVATLLANQNINLHWIAQLMGHKNLDMLAKRYLHPDTASLRCALGR